MTKKKYVKIRGERFLGAGIVICLVCFLVASFVGQALIQSNNSELERMKSKLSSQTEINDGIQMKINELANLDNALEVADAFGLEYNNRNIRVISE